MTTTINKRVLPGAFLIVTLLMSACGTLQMELEPVESTVKATSLPIETPVVTPSVVPDELTAIVERESTEQEVQVVEVATSVPTSEPELATTDWQFFQDDEYGIGLWHPPGTSIDILEPSSPTYCGPEPSECIVEEQIFSAVIMQEEGNQPGVPPGPQSVLEIKLIANEDGKNIGEVADLFSQRCMGELLAPITVATMTIQLAGYQYSCEGMVAFTEFWAAFGAQENLVFGAAWTDSSSPLSEEILSTVTFE